MSDEVRESQQRDASEAAFGPLTKDERDYTLKLAADTLAELAAIEPSGAATRVQRVYTDTVLPRYEATVCYLEAKISSLLAERAEDTERLDWLDGSAWISCSKTDESDNNGVGMVDSAVVLLSRNPDGKSDFPMQRAATFRKVIDSARSSGGNTK